MRQHYFYIILFSFLLSGCIPFEENVKSREEIDGFILLSKANEYAKRNNFDFAYEIYSDAYNKFTLIDHIEGKVKCIYGFVKVALAGGNDSLALSALGQLDIYSRINPGYREYFLTAKSEYFARRKSFPELISFIKANISAYVSNEANLKLAVLQLNAAGSVGWNINEYYEVVEKFLPEALSLEESKELEEPEIIGAAYYALGYADILNKRYQDAKKNFLLALEYDRKYANTKGIGDDLYHLGLIFKYTNEPTEALNYFERASEVYKIISSQFWYEVALVEKLALLPDNESTKIQLQNLLQSSQYPEIKEKITNILNR